MKAVQNKNKMEISLRSGAFESDGIENGSICLKKVALLSGVKLSGGTFE